MAYNTYRVGLAMLNEVKQSWPKGGDGDIINSSGCEAQLLQIAPQYEDIKEGIHCGNLLLGLA